MPHAFVNLYPELEKALARSLVLTTTERLRRELIRGFNEAQINAGRTAWTTPRVQTLNGYLSLLHSAARRRDPQLPELLSEEAEFELFRYTAPEGGADLVGLARDAWSMCRQWAIPIAARTFNSTENGRLFVEWSERLERRLRNMNAITRAELPRQPHLSVAEQELVCLSFEQLPQAYEEWLAAQNCPVTRLDARESPALDANRTSFESSSEELNVVAQWARELLATDREDLRIGIVVPDLAGRQAGVLRAFTAALDPWLTTGTQGLVDVGGGAALSDQPVWQPAREWLSLCFDSLSAARTRACLNSPFLALPHLPLLPRNLAPRLTLNLLTRQVDLPDLNPALAHTVAAAAGGRIGFGQWLGIFAETLELSGWNGQQAGSVQFQALQELRARLEALGRWADDRPMSAAEALQQLNHFLSGVLFAPERAPAPIQIMGYLETTGLAFSHLWVMGLDDETWPQLPNLNPFVPVNARRQHGVPRTSPEEEADFARDRLEHWQNSTRTMIVSHVRQSAESELRPSPLIGHLPLVEYLDYHPSQPHPGFLHRHDQLSEQPDITGRPLPAGTHRGGTGRIRDQATCPFRGYAIHRLDLSEKRTPHGLPDALDRGILIHEALHRLYDNALNDQIPAADLSDVNFGQAADQALGRHYARFPRAFRQRERERLIRILGAWNVLESRRGDVSIEALEQSATAEFGGLGLNLRIDRMDRIGEALIVIDYKTGRVGHRLNRERLLDPQLPLYALANPSVAGVLYAEVNEQKSRLRGISALTPDQVTLDEPLGGSWEKQRERWQQQIDTLTDEIARGFAAVAPSEKSACQNCHLHSFCRVDLLVEDPAP